MTTYIEKSYGLLFGGALGDSLGLATEFLNRETVRNFYGEKDFNYSEFYPDEFRKWWNAGDWTDDTNQMLIILEILTSRDVDRMTDLDIQKLFAEKLKFWRFNGHPELGQTNGVGIGTGVRWVMNEKCFLEDPQKASRIVWKNTMKSLCEDGCIMRTSLLGLIPNLDKGIKLTRIFCMTTHYHPKALACCIAIVAMVHSIVFQNYNDCDEIIEWGKDKALIEMRKHPHYNEKYEKSFLKYYKVQTLEDMKLDYGPYMSHVKKPFKCTLWALRQTKNKSFKDLDLWKNIIFQIIRMGGDADTNSCVAGSVLGCLLGYQQLPKQYIKELRNNEYLFKKCYYFIQSINKYPSVWNSKIEADKLYIVDINKYVLVKPLEFSRKEFRVSLGLGSSKLKKGDLIDWWGFGKMKNIDILNRKNEYVLNFF